MLHEQVSRRSFLLSGAGAVVAACALSWPSRATCSEPDIRIAAKPGRVSLVGGRHPDTDVWCYNGTVPGPEIRVRQGDRLRIALENRLPQSTTVHWHGLRVPNAMDGVPHVTQAPIHPEETFVYEFDVPDAGTFFYHPHLNGSEQMGRGLYGLLVVEERVSVPVDRDIAWALGDWRLDRKAAIREDFGGSMDRSHAGRIGDTVTVNGRLLDGLRVRAGERLRLRLVNAANARIFGLEFRGHEPRVVALDGQPVPSHEPVGGRVVLGPGMRADLVIDMNGRPGEKFPVLDTFYPRQAYRLLDLAYSEEAPVRERPLGPFPGLPPNPVPEPDLDRAERLPIVFEGGMMGGDMGAMMRGMMGGEGIWTVNGIAASGQAMKPFLLLRRGRSYVLALENRTAWHHPIHLHGHSFRVIASNGRRTRYREWRDTVLLAPRESSDIAFVADNPGDWMLHCHILEHQESGMMGVVRVA